MSLKLLGELIQEGDYSAYWTLLSRVGRERILPFCQPDEISQMLKDFFQNSSSAVVEKLDLTELLSELPPDPTGEIFKLARQKGSSLAFLMLLNTPAEITEPKALAVFEKVDSIVLDIPGLYSSCGEKALANFLQKNVPLFIKNCSIYDLTDFFLIAQVVQNQWQIPDSGLFVLQKELFEKHQNILGRLQWQLLQDSRLNLVTFQNLFLAAPNPLQIEQDIERLIAMEVNKPNLTVRYFWLLGLLKAKNASTPEQKEFEYQKIVKIAETERQEQIRVYLEDNSSPHAELPIDLSKHYLDFLTTDAELLPFFLDEWEKLAPAYRPERNLLLKMTEQGQHLDRLFKLIDQAQETKSCLTDHIDLLPTMQKSALAAEKILTLLAQPDDPEQQTLTNSLLNFMSLDEKTVSSRANLLADVTLDARFLQLLLRPPAFYTGRWHDLIVTLTQPADLPTLVTFGIKNQVSVLYWEYLAEIKSRLSLEK